MALKKTSVSLVPGIVNPTPDYYCTWQTQLYATSDGKPPLQRSVIGEKGLFEKEKPYGWAYFYEKAHGDLFLVMDDSWDVPPEGNPALYGSLILDKEKFPLATQNANTNAEALKHLTDRVRALGWKGLGGWVCAQESRMYFTEKTAEEYWQNRLKEAEEAGFSYWKVDWGKRGSSVDFRKMLTEMGRTLAPKLVIEHAVNPAVIPFADVYRTYDVPAIMSIPMTMQKLKEFSLVCEEPQDGALSLLNCEDEAYIAAAGGFSMGIMRHPYHGDFPNGKPDMSFPVLHRNLKTKMFEVIRAVRFHRIAPAFGLYPNETQFSELMLSDTWRLQNIDEELEAWWLEHPAIKDCLHNGVITKTAPACISRGCTLSEVQADENGKLPYIVAAKNPNGVYAIAALGRTEERSYAIPLCDVAFEIQNADTVGIFGEYRNLMLKTTRNTLSRVLMQDLAGDTAYDITDKVSFENGILTIMGSLIHKIGTEAQPADDTSEPGAILRIE